MTSRKDQALYWKRAAPYAYVPVAAMVRAFNDSPLGRQRAHDLAHAPDLTIKVTGAAVPTAPAVAGAGAGASPSAVAASGKAVPGSSSSSLTSVGPAAKPPLVSSEHWPADPLTRSTYAMSNWAMLKVRVRAWTLCVC